MESSTTKAAGPTGTGTTTPDMRTMMPTVAQQVNAWRGQYGRAWVNGCIKRGLTGEPGWFFAMEGGHVLGTPARAMDVEAFSVQGFALLMGGRGAAFIREPQGSKHATH